MVDSFWVKLFDFPVGSFYLGAQITGQYICLANIRGNFSVLLLAAEGEESGLTQ